MIRDKRFEISLVLLAGLCTALGGCVKNEPRQYRFIVPKAQKFGYIDQTGKQDEDAHDTGHEAARALAACEDLSGEVSKKLKEMLKQPDSIVREHALIAMSGLGSDRRHVAGVAMRLLSDDEASRVRVRAASILGERSDWPDRTAVVKALANALHVDKSPGVRMVSALSLAVVDGRSREALEAFRESLQDTDTDVVLYTLCAIGTVGTHAQTLVPDVAEKLRSDDPRVVDRAIATIVGIGSPAVEAMGRKLLEADDDECRAASIALARIDANTRVGLPELAAGFTSPRDVVRLYTVGAVRELGPKASVYVPSILSILRTDRNARVRWAAATAILTMGAGAKPHTNDILKAMKGESSYRVRATIAEWIGQSTGNVSRLIDHLIDEMKTDESAVVRAACARSLGNMGVREERVISALRAASTEKDVRVRRDATDALRRIQGVATPSKSPSD